MEEKPKKLKIAMQILNTKLFPDIHIQVTIECALKRAIIPTVLLAMLMQMPTRHARAVHGHPIIHSA